MFRKFIVATIVGSGLFLAGPVLPHSQSVAQAAPMPHSIAYLYVAERFDGNKPMNGLTLYKWYYVNRASERSALDADIVAFKLEGWAYLVKYGP